MVIILNGLKAINDSFGHQEGDKLIVDCAALLSETVKETVSDADKAFLARLGGDEFVIVIPGTGLKKAHEIRRTICGKIQTANLSRSETQKLRLAVGIAAATVEPLNCNETFKQADDRMYRFKRLSKQLSKKDEIE